MCFVRFVLQAVRAKNGLGDNKVMDCLAVWCCGVCSIHQVAKESGAPVIPESKLAAGRSQRMGGERRWGTKGEAQTHTHTRH